MRREFFILANVNETQRSSATLSGMSGRQKGKGQADGAGESGNSIIFNCDLLDFLGFQSCQRHSRSS